MCIHLHLHILTPISYRYEQLRFLLFSGALFPFSHMYISSFISFNFSLFILHRKRIVGNSFHLWYNICLLGFFSSFDLIWFDFFSVVLCLCFLSLFFSILSAQVVALGVHQYIATFCTQHKMSVLFYLFATFLCAAFAMCRICLCIAFDKVTKHGLTFVCFFLFLGFESF